MSVACRALLNEDLTLSQDESFERHTKVIGEVIALIAEVGDASNLTLDPDIDSYYLMNVLIFQGPELSEALAQARGLGIGMITAKNTTPEQLAQLNRLSNLAAYLQTKVGRLVDGKR